MRIQKRKLALRHGLVDMNVLSTDTIAAFVNSNRRKVLSMLPHGINSVAWNRTCAIGGEVSLCDRRVSRQEAADFVGCSWKTIQRHLGRSINRLRFSDLEEMKISRGCVCEYKQVCNLSEMEELVESNRARGRVTFSWVAQENIDNLLLDKALFAAIRSGNELEGFETEYELGRLEEPEGHLDARKYLGDRRKISSTRISDLQKRMVEKRWACLIHWQPSIDNVDWEFMYTTKGAYFGGNCFVRVLRWVVRVFLPFYIGGKGAGRLLRVANRYYRCLRFRGILGLGREF